MIQIHPMDALVKWVNDGLTAARYERVCAARTRTLAEAERSAILEAVARCRGDIVAAAKRLGIGRTTIYRKLKEYEANSR